PRRSRLTGREWQTLERLLAGDSEKQAASALGVSTHTLHSYVKRVYAVFGVETRAELMARFVPDVPVRTLRELIKAGQLSRGRGSIAAWFEAIRSAALQKGQLPNDQLSGAMGRAARSRPGTAPPAPGGVPDAQLASAQPRSG